MDRSQLLNQAITFLRDTSVSGSPLSEKLTFLEGKGLSPTEVREALRRAEYGGGGGGGLLHGLRRWALDTVLPTALVAGAGFALYALTTQSTYFDSPPPELPNLPQDQQQQYQQEQAGFFGLGAGSGLMGGMGMGMGTGMNTGMLAPTSSLPSSGSGGPGGPSSSSSSSALTRQNPTARGVGTSVSVDTELDVAELKSAVREAVAQLSDPLVVAATAGGGIGAVQPPDWARELTQLCRSLVKDVADIRRRQAALTGDVIDDRNGIKVTVVSLEKRLSVLYDAVLRMCLDNCEVVGIADEIEKEVGSEEGKGPEQEKEKEKEKEQGNVVPSAVKPSAKLVSATGALCMYFSKIAENPDVPRYRRLSSTNKIFAKSVAPVSGHVEVLLAVGFREMAGTGYEWNWHQRNDNTTLGGGMQNGDRPSGPGTNETETSTTEAPALVPCIEDAMTVVQEATRVLALVKAGDLGWYHARKASVNEGRDKDGQKAEVDISGGSDGEGVGGAATTSHDQDIPLGS